MDNNFVLHLIKTYIIFYLFNIHFVEQNPVNFKDNQQKTNQKNMTNYFCINRYLYSTNENETLSIHTDKREALDQIESFVLQYIQEKDGSQKIPDLDHLPKILYSDKTIGTVGTPTLTPGHYISRGDQLDTYTVWRYLKEAEVVPGRLWGKYTTEKLQLRKVFTITIVSTQSELFQKVRRIQFLSKQIPALSELKRMHSSDSESESDSNSIDSALKTLTPKGQYDLFVRSFDESKTMKKIQSSYNSGKEVKFAELRFDNKEFTKCPRAKAPTHIEVKEPQYDDMVKEMKLVQNKIGHKEKSLDKIVINDSSKNQPKVEEKEIKNVLDQLSAKKSV